VTALFVDTSALYALLVATDRWHGSAARIMRSLRTRDAELVTSSHVLLETYALLGSRIGVDAVEGLRESVEPLLDVRWVDRELHERALDVVIAGGGRPGLVDATSFLVMRDRGIESAFTFDRDFETAGFAAVTDPG
jgi:predicted nucleic acid-binding protein